MGTIIRRVTICGLTEGGRRLKCVEDVSAVVDTGSTKTVISTGLAKKLGGKLLRDVETSIEGRYVPLKLAGVTLQAPGCSIDALVVAVDDDLVHRAGRDEDGEPIEIILGHDYLQNQRASVTYTRPPSVSCEVVGDLRGSDRKPRARR